jgi:hypothetical protein
LSTLLLPLLPFTFEIWLLSNGEDLMMQFLCGAAEEVESSFMRIIFSPVIPEFGAKIMLGI